MESDQICPRLVVPYANTRIDYAGWCEGASARNVKDSYRLCERGIHGDK